MGADAGPERRVARALLSVQDKSGIGPFAQGLSALGVELWSTAGTRKSLDGLGCRSGSVEELTGVDAWFGGRVKTLHPAVFGGILAPRTAEGVAETERRGLRTFDLVVVNFYPFERHLAESPGAPDREEFIDIGGVALARAAAKNHEAVAVATDPSQYPTILEELRARGGHLGPKTRRALAVAAFERCARYDAAIAVGLGNGPRPSFPSTLAFAADALSLRYGENPHQPARAYALLGGPSLPAVPLEMVKGDAPSYTNLLDLETALDLVEEFEVPAAAIVKHATPCGVATGATLGDALQRAIATDPVARYGCAIAVNRALGPDEPALLHGVFVDFLLAPGFDARALEALERRPKLKLARAPIRGRGLPRWEGRTALGRLLVQEADQRPLQPGDLRRVAGAELAPSELEDLRFAWSVVRHARSNAIVLARDGATVGIGSGQPTRVKAVELAVEVAGDRARGSLLASDAFFPFADGIEVAGRAGVRAILQPGGSVRDGEVIAAAERAGMTMYFSGWRVFRH